MDMNEKVATAQQIVLFVEQNGCTEIHNGVFLLTAGEIIEEQKTWAEEDAGKAFDFSGSKFWITTDNEVTPIGVDNAEELVELMPNDWIPKLVELVLASSPSVEERIEQAKACEVIRLSEEEKGIYAGGGCGWKLARFEDAKLVALYDPCGDMPMSDDLEQMANEATQAALAWIAMAKGEVWLVMCSCYELCEPRRITMTDAGAIARMARVFGEFFANFDE